VGTIEEILASGETLSSGDRILALRNVGREQEAFVLARKTMDEGLTDAERRTATDQVIAMRYQRPGYSGGS
jgi:phosphoribosylaminoimidazole (AIR) synthetase